ncbi:MAG: hypothetical protein IPM54_11830 [Polyangiaceae bacterium]|nr:hypothetical protein [Polyangiaceae bacterium]
MASKRRIEDTINRQEVRSDARREVDCTIERARYNILPRYYESIESDATRVEEVKYLALAAEIYNDIRPLRDTGKLPLLADWKDIEYEKTGYVLRDIVEAQQVMIVEDPQWSSTLQGHRAPELRWSDDRKVLTICSRDAGAYLWLLLRDRHAILCNVSNVASANNYLQSKFEWLLVPTPPDDVIKNEKSFRYILREATEALRSARRTIPCRKQFLAMAVAPEADYELQHCYRIFPRLKPRAISPFRVGADEKISLDGVEALVKWTYEHRLEIATTERDIARAVIDLVETAHAMLGAEWGERKDYSVDELRRNFVKLYGKEVLPAPVEESKTGA